MNNKRRLKSTKVVIGHDRETVMHYFNTSYIVSHLLHLSLNQQVKATFFAQTQIFKFILQLFTLKSYLTFSSLNTFPSTKVAVFQSPAALSLYSFFFLSFFLFVLFVFFLFLFQPLDLKIINRKKKGLQTHQISHFHFSSLLITLSLSLFLST